MWRDFASDPVPVGLTTFAFPEPHLPVWTELWRSVVRQVAVTPDDASKTSLLDSFAQQSGVRTLGFVNAHALNSCVNDPHFAGDLLALDHIVRDGIGVHALYRLIGAHSGLNLNGTDLLPELMARFAGRPIALFGTALPFVERVAEQLRISLGSEVTVADGFQRDGYYLERVASERPALVVLGMGMPKQERVARLMKHGLRQDVAIVCGGAILDFLSGRRSRAPLWMRKTGLEWMYRLSLEPKRLFGRYVIGNPLFLLRSLILSGRPSNQPPKPRAISQPQVPSAPFGIGAPTLKFADATPAVNRPVIAPTVPVSPMAAIIPVGAATTEFSANRPVVALDDLFGRQADLDRLLSWVLDQSGNALIYGPRGYGKTSLVRVFGEIADSRHHVVLYASCSRRVDFSALMRMFLDEIPAAARSLELPDTGRLTVQQVATQLAALRDMSLVIILDEFDRIERDETRENIVELVKDVSDLTASVRFVLVGVATDATSILGYHPSIHRCITCVPLKRLNLDAIDALFRRKSAADGLIVPDGLRQQVLQLAAGSAYHAQLIGQKLVSRARLSGRDAVTNADIAGVIDEIVADATLMDASFDGLVRQLRASTTTRAQLVALSRLTLDDPHDQLHIKTDGSDNRMVICQALTSAGLLQRVDASALENTVAFRFSNAFMPQLILMVDYRCQILIAV